MGFSSRMHSLRIFLCKRELERSARGGATRAWRRVASRRKTPVQAFLACSQRAKLIVSLREFAAGC